MDSSYCREGLYTYELWCIIFDVVKLLIQCILLLSHSRGPLECGNCRSESSFNVGHDDGRLLSTLRSVQYEVAVIRLDLQRWASSLHTQVMVFYVRKQTREAGLLGQRKEVWTKGSYYFTVTREAARRMVASHTRQEIRKCFLGTILILSHM
jgi:hypothetical protein